MLSGSFCFQPHPPVYVYVSCLTDAMTAVLRLGVHRRIPVTVVEDDRVSAGQVHPDATRARRQDEHEDSFVRVEAVHQKLQDNKWSDTRQYLGAYVGHCAKKEQRLHATEVKMLKWSRGKTGIEMKPSEEMQKLLPLSAVAQW